MNLILSLILSSLPIRAILVKVLSRLTDLGEDFLEDLLDKVEALVLKAESKYGRGHGQEKFQEVKEQVMELYSVGSGWLVNLLIEIVVAYLKKEKALP